MIRRSLAGLGMLCCCCCSGAGEPQSTAPSVAPRIATPGWTDGRTLFVLPEADGALLVRCLSQDESLRVTHSQPVPDSAPAMPVYRFTPTSGALNEVQADVWRRAFSESRIRLSWPYREPAPFGVAGQGDKLTYSGKPVVTPAPHFVTLAVAPKGDRVAVLSAAGRESRSLNILGAGRTFSGPSIHRLFRLSDGAPVGDPVRLDRSEDAGELQCAWSPDCRFILYSSPDFSHVWIISASAPKEDTP